MRMLDLKIDRGMFFQGLRFAALAGAIGTTLGSWIKVFSVSPGLFWVTFIGQTLVAVSQSFVLSVPARLAAVWFGPDQVSSACSIGVFGNQVSSCFLPSFSMIFQWHAHASSLFPCLLRLRVS